MKASLDLTRTGWQLWAAIAALTTLTACDGQPTDNNLNRAFAAAAQGADLASARQPDRVPLVVGGTDVKHGRYEFMAAILNRNESDPVDGQFCGGSLVASGWVLTAAHCVEDARSRDVSVLLGQRNLDGTGGEQIRVSRIVSHPDYPSKGYPDLALLELASASQAKPISLASRGMNEAAPGESAVVTGWGQISENGPATNELREARVPVVEHSVCNRAYGGGIIEDAMVCAGGKTDSCYGDSGGPLFIQRDNAFVQAGVVSFGERCGLADVPGVYARVSSYHDWITAYIGDTPPDGDPDPVDPMTFSYSGALYGWGAYKNEPRDPETISLGEGQLQATLTVPRRRAFVLFLDRYDPVTGDWEEVASVDSRRGTAVLDYYAMEGQYGFTVMSLGRGGRYSLEANLSR